jgi:hypothetical protein
MWGYKCASEHIGKCVDIMEAVVLFCEGYSYNMGDGSAVRHFGYVESHREVGRLAEPSTTAEQGDVPRPVAFGVGICGTCVAA